MPQIKVDCPLRLNPRHEPTQQQIAALERLLDPNDRSALVPEKPENMSLLVGSHVGALGPASCSLSVCIVTYNSASTIETCAESVLADLPEDGELILVENASQDGTQTLLEKLGGRDPRIQVVLNQENVCYSKGMNQGLLMSKGEHLVMLNPDTKIYPGCFASLKSRLVEGVGAVGPVSNYVTGEQQVVFQLQDANRPRMDELPKVLAETRSNCSKATKLLMGFCLMIPRTLLDSIGHLDESIALGADDLELSWRLRAVGWELRIAEDTFVLYHGAVSFTSLEKNDRSHRVKASDDALLQKLELFFGKARVPNSINLWGTPILSLN